MSFITIPINSVILWSITPNNHRIFWSAAPSNH